MTIIIILILIIIIIQCLSRLLNSTSITWLILPRPLNSPVIEGQRLQQHSRDGGLCHVKHLFSVWVPLGTPYHRLCWSSCPVGVTSCRVHFEGAVLPPVPVWVRRCLCKPCHSLPGCLCFCSTVGWGNFCCGVFLYTVWLYVAVIGLIMKLTSQ